MKEIIIINEEIEKQKKNLGIRIFGETLKAYVLKIEFNIKKIEYISDKKATIIVTMKSPDLGNNLEFFEKKDEVRLIGVQLSSILKSNVVQLSFNDLNKNI